MNPHFEIFPGRALDDEQALAVISRMRRRFHQGPPESRVVSIETLEKFRKFRKRPDGIVRLPDDIREFRMQHYGETLEDLSFGPIQLTIGVFPPPVKEVELSIFSHPGFLSYQWVYYSWLTLGSYVAEASPAEIREFLELHWESQVAEHFYIFDEDLRWCIARFENYYVKLCGDLPDSDTAGRDD